MTTRGDGEKLFRLQGLEIFGDAARPARRHRPTGMVREPARDTPLLAETDVLVVGGGPAGVAAAIGAARLGADVLLVERYNHLGGLSTGGLVIWIDRMSDWTGRHVIRGIAEELMDRLPATRCIRPPAGAWGARDEATAAYWTQRTAAFHGVVTWSPTIDPEWLKTACMDDGARAQGAALPARAGRSRRSPTARRSSRAPSSRARRAATPSAPRW